MPDRPLTLAFLGDPNSVHLRRWVTFFVRRGHQVHLLVPRDMAVEPGLDELIRVERFTDLPPRITPSAAIRTRRDLRRVLTVVDPDVLHAHYARRPAWLAWLSGRRPYAVTIWGSDVLIRTGATARALMVTRLALRGAALVTAESKHLADAAVELGARRERVRQVVFGVDTDRFAPGPSPEGLRRSLGVTGRRVVFSARALTPLYRHETALSALAALPPDTVLMIPGMNGSPATRAGLEARAAELGLAERLRIVPAIPHGEMPDYFRLAEVVVSIPESDGVPVTILEAMACGRQIVATDLPSVHEWLVGSAPELLVPVGDAGATARALMRALKRPAKEKEALGAALRRVVIAHADETRNLSFVEAWYRELAGSGSRSGFAPEGRPR